jgi:hypothetical protein
LSQASSGTGGFLYAFSVTRIAVFGSLKRVTGRIFRTVSNFKGESVLRIRDVYPGSRILIFTHPGSRIQKQQQKRGVKKKFVVITFYVATNFTKLQIILVFEVLKKKMWANFQRIIELFTQKIVTKLSKIWIWDTGS